MVRAAALALLGCRRSMDRRTEGCWILWLGVQGVQDTMVRGAERCGKEVQEGRGGVQGGVQGTLTRA